MNDRLNVWETKKIAFTLSASPCAAARALALWAWMGLRVIPWHLAPNLLAMYLELPPIPHPTSTTLLGHVVGSSANQFRTNKQLLKSHLHSEK
jgi:hypothetical protein